MKLKQPRLDAVTARIQELSKKQIAFIEKNDIERATTLNEDMAKLQEEYQKILDEGGGQQQLEAAAARASKDLQMNISITVNDGGQMFGPEVSKPCVAPTGRGRCSSLGKHLKGHRFEFRRDSVRRMAERGAG